jgi:hypothetical protein
MALVAKGLIAIMMVGVTLVGLPGCGGGGAESKTEVTNTTVSKGQQLIDLKKALDAGAISESDFERERKRILDQ